MLGDDLALNAQQVSGVRADRELPVVWRVAKGSFVNKLILVPLALLISALAPQLISPLLIMGGLYLCFEGVEKIWHSIAHKRLNKEHKASLRLALADDHVNLAEFEKTKIKGAIRTDFVLSAEIIVIALGTVSNESLMIQGLVVGLIALCMTVGVYGVVAFIVKLDDMGLYLMTGDASGVLAGIKKSFGRLILAFCPFLMKSLSIIGTAAMFLVGGGIVVHGVGFLHHYVEAILVAQHYAVLMGQLINFVIGVASGASVLVLLKSFLALKNKFV